MTAETMLSRDGEEDMAIRSSRNSLRVFAMAAGIACALLFVAAGVWNGLQMYGDGSFFSYAVAVREAWSFWQNMSGRLFVYLFAYIPSQAYVGLTKDAGGGVALYGFLFFAAQFLGLAATFTLDASKGRTLFAYACASTACLCPLVFGSPTETWMAHALFWPALALCHRKGGGILKLPFILAALLALIFTHEGALIFAFTILISLAPRGPRDVRFLRVLAVLPIVLAVWAAVKILLPPDALMADILWRGALHVFDLAILTGDLVLLFFAAASLYAVALLLFWRLRLDNGHLYAALLTGLVLAAWWALFDHALHAENRYYLRTILLVGTPAFGLLAVLHALHAEGELHLPIPLLPRLLAALTGEAAAKAAMGAFALVLLIHAVETAKFVNAWAEYKAALRRLAMSDQSDPSLGDPRFVSSLRLDEKLRPLAWVTTTPFLSVLVAPNFAPRRLVVDPYAGFFWFSCETATANLKAERAIPAESRKLVQIYSCLHR